jgi:uncharacterized protein
MQLLDGSVIYSATDLNNYLECRHLIALEREVARGLRVRPVVENPTADLIARKGDEHEQKWLHGYEVMFGARVARLDRHADNSLAGLAAAEAETVAAMASGAAIVYQATFFDGVFVGHADFLRRIEEPCARWEWSYEVIDTKLALSAKPYFLIQLANYSEHLERLQGTAPKHGYVVFGNGEERPFRLADYSAYYRHLKASFVNWMQAGGDAYPLEVGHCDVCKWSGTCARRRDADDHLSLVAGIRGDQIQKLEDAGITTMTALAEAADRPYRMSEATFDNLRIQATLQVMQRRAIAEGDTYPYRYRIREPEAEPAADVAPDQRNGEAPEQKNLAGFAKLPRPATGDVFFDIEGDPLYTAERGLQYLFGLYAPDEDRYIALWGKDPVEERAAFEQCVDFIEERRLRYPDMHVYHYASYERTALGKLMGHFGSRETEVDRFFRRGLFVDLYPVVRQALWVSQPSYSLKKVEAFYGQRRDTQTLGGDDSIVMFEAWLASGDANILEDIRRYNEDDCRSTHALRDWVVGLRDELNAMRSAPIPWRQAVLSVEEPEATERTELEAKLLASVPAPDTLDALRKMPVELRERWLLGNILQYHRRENKPEYWEYFHRCENVEDLAEFDRKAIGGLRRCWDIEPVRRPGEKNFVYVFDYPEQEHDIHGKPYCPDSRKPVTEIVGHDEAARRIWLRLSKGMATSIRALIPGQPMHHGTRQEGVERIAKAFLEGLLEREHPATSALLRSALPRLRGSELGARLEPDTVDGPSLARVISQLDGSYLFVQGPPGTGKSTVGAAAVVELLNDGQRVGLMANSHKVLHGLLRKIESAAVAAGFRFDGVHKMTSSTEDSEYFSALDQPMVRSAERVDPLDATLVSGTAFFWSGDALTGTFDTIVIDEAGQVSLADALNAAMAARNVVLLGDPRQLPQVSQGTHPVGSDRPVLEHLLDGLDTVPPHRGIFLDVSFRMQPELAHFVSVTSYEGRLHAGPKTATNRIDSSGLSGAGLAYIPVVHEGNGRFSVEEADRIAAEVTVLMRDGTFTRFEEAPQAFRQSDILVVAPYNLQRRRIREALDAAGFPGVEVGTVDKFQGQQAPVVFYSMATSSDDDLPRDMAFLFDRNRFNVAVSRAQCLSVLVCSPRLLDARCRNSEQMGLVNLLCAFVESAGEARPAAGDGYASMSEERSVARI